MNRLRWLCIFSNSLRTTQNEAVGGCRMARLEPVSAARIITSGSVRGKYKGPLNRLFSIKIDRRSLT